ncbi:MAG TPA: HAD hydrolase-like protein [Elusimicrobiota bacterium]|nr:HAD hydrolase-like protein [Elusimicrobiota bacterium]
MIAPSSIQAVIFDFDGVILESADIKTEAFRELFSFSPRHQKRIVDYHVRHAGIDRFRKFEHIYRTIIKAPLCKEQKRRLGAKFSRIVYQKVLECPFVPGVLQFLKRNHRRMQLFVISGTPQNELKLIIKKRELDRFFKRVYGSPRTKTESTINVLNRFRLIPSQTRFVGDALADYDAAKKYHIPFIGRVARGKRNPFPPHTLRIRDLRGLAPLLGRHGKRQ